MNCRYPILRVVYEHYHQKCFSKDELGVQPMRTVDLTCNHKVNNCKRAGQKKDLPLRLTNSLYSAPSGHGSIDEAKCLDIAASPGIEPVHDASGKPLRQRTTTWDKQIPWFINPPSALIILATWRSFRSNFDCQRQADKECHDRSGWHQ